MAYENYGMTATRARAEVLGVFMRGVYKWMSIGLAVTAAAAYLVATSPAAQQAIFGNQMVFFGLIIGELALVFGLSAAISRLSAGAANGLFLLYSALNGLTLSAVLLAYTGASVFMTFVICAGMFGAMSVYGMTTKKDLTSMGSFLFMGLIGILLASVVNMFMHSSAMNFVISIIGVIVFTGLTAYDTQKLRYMGETMPAGDDTAVQRGTILGALTLYLDFINLFLMLLRFFGARRD